MSNTLEISQKERDASEKHRIASEKCDAAYSIRNRAGIAWHDETNPSHKADLLEIWGKACEFHDKLWIIEKEAFAEYEATWED